ncbi:MAG: EamA family transporter, partial [Planctomycetaceae bacterium]
SSRDARWIGAIAAFGLIGSSGLMLCSTRLVSCTVVCLLTTLTPAVTAAGAALFLRDRPNWQKNAWMILGALAAIGLAMTCRGCGPIAESPAALLLGGGLVLAAICCEASYTLVAKVVTARTAPLTVAAVSTIAAAVALAPPAAVEAATFDWDGLSPLAALAAVWWGAGALALGSWLWYSGVRQVRGSTAAAAMTALPVCTLLLSQLVGD